MDPDRVLQAGRVTPEAFAKMREIIWIAACPVPQIDQNEWQAEHPKQGIADQKEPNFGGRVGHQPSPSRSSNAVLVRATLPALLDCRMRACVAISIRSGRSSAALRVAASRTGMVAPACASAV